MTELTYQHDTAVDDPDTVLGAVWHGLRPGGATLDQGFPQVTAHTAHSAPQAFGEVWRTRSPVSRGRRGPVVYGHDDDTLFAACTIADVDHLRTPAADAYTALTRTVDDLDFRLCRIWNYISDINGANPDGLERYQDFCRGRAEALEQSGGAWTEQLPAATGIGSLGGGVVVCALASRAARPRHFENPRQLPAYRYPRRYGPRSPSFARATLVPHGEAALLHVSGTASVVGHETAHPDDPRAQSRTTADNLRCLIEHVEASTGLAAGLEDFRHVKAYVRHPGDVPVVEHELRRIFARDVDLRVLTVDICRRDLLVEVEGLVALRR